MNLGLIFAIIVALLIGWFLFDKPVQPGEVIAATITNVKAINTPSGPPSADVTVRLADGSMAQFKVEQPGNGPRPPSLDAGNAVQVRKLTRRISGTVSYELVR